MAEAIVRAGEIISSITIRVKGIGAATARLRAARAIFWFGAFIAGCAIEIELDDTRPPM